MANRLAEYEQRAAQTSQGAQWPQDMQSDAWQARLNSLTQQASQWIVEHPEIALATAVATGVVLGWLIKRR